MTFQALVLFLMAVAIGHEPLKDIKGQLMGSAETAPTSGCQLQKEHPLTLLLLFPQLYSLVLYPATSVSVSTTSYSFPGPWSPDGRV